MPNLSNCQVTFNIYNSFVPSLNCRTVIIVQIQCRRLENNRPRLIVKCNSSSNVNQYESLCLSQFQLGTSPPPGNPGENFFERANPGHPGKFFCLIPCPGTKNDGQIPRGGAKFSRTRRNCSVLSLEKSLKN